jgi:hypothetical protein
VLASTSAGAGVCVCSASSCSAAARLRATIISRRLRPDIDFGIGGWFSIASRAALLAASKALNYDIKSKSQYMPKQTRKRDWLT